MAKPAEPLPERRCGETGGQKTGKEGDEYSWGLNKSELGAASSFDEQPDFVNSTFKLLPRYPSRSIEEPDAGGVGFLVRRPFGKV